MSYEAKKKQHAYTFHYGELFSHAAALKFVNTVT